MSNQEAHSLLQISVQITFLSCSQKCCYQAEPSYSTKPWLKQMELASTMYAHITDFGWKTAQHVYVQECGILLRWVGSSKNWNAVPVSGEVGLFKDDFYITITSGRMAHCVMLCSMKRPTTQKSHEGPCISLCYFKPTYVSSINKKRSTNKYCGHRKTSSMHSSTIDVWLC